ncbi:MAG: ATP-binding protein [Anaerolineales bacterium]
MSRRLSEFLFPALILGILILFSFARFYLVSYIGFQYNGSTGEVLDVHDLGVPSPLEQGDIILEIDGKPWGDIPVSRRPNPLANARTGETLSLLVAGDDGNREVSWLVPGFNSSEFTGRLVNTWVLSFIFWLAGTAAVVLVRPRDIRRTLLAALNYVTAIWFLAGTMSNSGVLESPFVMRVGIWISLPVYLHFHYNFPRPMGNPYLRFSTFLYIIAAGLAAAQWLEWLPSSMYLLALLGAALGSLGILIYRFIKRPQERREIGLLFFAVAVALLPTLGVAFNASQVDSPLSVPGLLLSLVALPGAYFYVVYRRQLGGLEFRANRLISIYLFLVLLVTLCLLMLPLVGLFVPWVNDGAASLLLTALVTSLFSLFAFPRFQTFVERRLLGIPQPPQHILEGFAGRISTSFSHQNLAETLMKEVLPSLLVRQSALLDFESKSFPGYAVYLQTVDRKQLPAASQLKSLPPEKILVPRGENSSLLTKPADWVQVVLPLTLAGQLRGYWLLGRKDPDDYYSQSELNLLRSLADQMVIALANISQAQSLRALHQSDIERQEVERVHLARELHDDVLQRINELSDQVDEAAYAKGFGKRLEDLVGQVRSLINGLRPPLMDQGLYYALLNLTDELAHKPLTRPKITLELPISEARFNPMVEQHVYRIVQQACENALQHSDAKQLTIRGGILPDGADLVVEDDGKGFELDGQAALAALLSTRHFGLASMHERAAMINARLTVDTAPGAGTRVQLRWQEKKENI